MHITIVLSIAAVLVFLHTVLENHQRGVLLRWSDERDEEFARLWEAAYKLTVLPKDNPLANFKQHGMLAKDAFMRADVLIPALDERLGVLDIGLNAVSREAKALKTWEQMHPAPPRHYWRVRFHKKAAPAPTATVAKSGILDAPVKQLGDGRS